MIVSILRIFCTMVT